MPRYEAAKRVAGTRHCQMNPGPGHRSSETTSSYGGPPAGGSGACMIPAGAWPYANRTLEIS